MSFDLQSFLLKPSTEQLYTCRKADLIDVAKHFKVDIQPGMRKDIRKVVLEFLVKEEVLLDSKPDIPLASANVFEIKKLEYEYQLKLEQERNESQLVLEKERLAAKIKMKELELRLISSGGHDSCLNVTT